MGDKKILILSILATVVVAGVLITQGLVSEEDYATLKANLIAKQQNWELCLEKGKIKIDDDGIYTSCNLEGKDYEPFTPLDWQALTSIMDLGTKKVGKLEVKPTAEKSIYQGIIDKIK
ncbi:MAG: hypothetical protein NTV30_08900 [Chloroflexi bacterium]|nr:hypothetical protein [Chloroflexota bacterium]